MAIAASRKASVLPAVRAFSQSHSGFRTPAASMGLASNILLQSEQNRKSNSNSNSNSRNSQNNNKFFQCSRHASSTTEVAATVEEDLDSALDEILGSAFEEAGDVKPIAETETETSETDADADVEADAEGSSEAVSSDDGWDIPVDFTDPKFLSTTNPYWTSKGMNQKVIDVLSGKGISRFTEVQGKAFEPALEGSDVIGRSRTGTGKTIAFGLPAVHRLVELAEKNGELDSYGKRKRGRNVSMIALCPTRELARQVEDEIAQIARPLGLFTTVFHGGVSYDPQVSYICVSGAKRLCE